jgi:cell division protein FtsQ
VANIMRRSEPMASVTSDGRPADERTRRRFVRRQWRRRWHVWRIVLGGVTFAGAVAAVVWAVYFSTWLSVSSVQVQGVDLLTPQQVRAVAQTPLGEPVATIDLAQIDARVSALAPVKSVDVTRLWPDQILIEIEERKVLAVVDLGGQLRGMDENGVLFRDFRRAPRQIPRIRTELAVDTDTLQEAGKVLSALPDSVGARVSYVSVETIDRISLVLRDGRVVLWGSAEESADKARVLEQLLRTRARSYDVSVPGLPTYRQ